jgi:hypothetical protein
LVFSFAYNVYARSFVNSFITTVRQAAPPAAVGYTHASSVIAVVRRSDAESATLTMLLVPLNVSALPYLPDVVQVALESVPVLLLPEASLVVVPVPSSKLYEATGPLCACAALPKQSAKQTAMRLKKRFPERSTDDLPDCVFE